MSQRSRWIMLGAVGAIGMAGGVVADMLSGFAVEGAGAIASPFSVLELDNLQALLAGKPYWHFVAGNHVALVFIPLGIFGVLHVARFLEPAGVVARRVWIGLGVGGYLVGTAFHLMYGFLGIAMKAGAEVPGGAPGVALALDHYRLLFQPVAIALIVIMSVALLWVTALILMGRTAYPRWFVLATPLAVQLVTGLGAAVAPTALRIALIVTSYNASFLVFFAASTVYALRRPAEVRPL